LNQRTQTQILDEDEKLAFESSVKLFGIINSKGRMIDSVGSGTIDMPDKKKEMFLMKIALRNSMQRDFDEELGEVDYCMTQRGNKKYISIPIKNGNTMLVVARKDVNTENIVTSVNKMMNYSKIVKDFSKSQGVIVN